MAEVSNGICKKLRESKDYFVLPASASFGNFKNPFETITDKMLFDPRFKIQEESINM